MFNTNDQGYYDHPSGGRPSDAGPSAPYIQSPHFVPADGHPSGSFHPTDQRDYGLPSGGHSSVAGPSTPYHQTPRHTGYGGVPLPHGNEYPLGFALPNGYPHPVNVNTNVPPPGFAPSSQQPFYGQNAAAQDQSMMAAVAAPQSRSRATKDKGKGKQVVRNPPKHAAAEFAAKEAHKKNQKLAQTARSGYKCNKCPMRTSTLEELAMHQGISHTVWVYCDFCGQVSIDPRNLAHHASQQCPGSQIMALGLGLNQFVPVAAQGPPQQAQHYGQDGNGGYQQGVPPPPQGYSYDGSQNVAQEPPQQAQHYRQGRNGGYPQGVPAPTHDYQDQNQNYPSGAGSGQGMSGQGVVDPQAPAHSAPAPPAHVYQHCPMPESYVTSRNDILPSGSGQAIAGPSMSRNDRGSSEVVAFTSPHEDESNEEYDPLFDEAPAVDTDMNDDNGADQPTHDFPQMPQIPVDGDPPTTQAQQQQDLATQQEQDAGAQQEQAADDAEGDHVAYTEVGQEPDALSELEALIQRQEAARVEWESQNSQASPAALDSENTWYLLNLSSSEIAKK